MLLFLSPLYLPIPSLFTPNTNHLWFSQKCPLSWSTISSGVQMAHFLKSSPNFRTGVWVNSERWWWTGRPGVLQSMESQRVGHEWAIELSWNFRHLYINCGVWKIFRHHIYYYLFFPNWFCIFSKYIYLKLHIYDHCMQKISVIYDKKKIFKEQCVAFKIKKHIYLFV